MDRAQELRTLMKLGGKADSGGAVSGKDKAKMLKLMREQQKQKETAQQQQKAKPPAPAAKPIIPESSAPSGLPAGFFDNAPVQAVQTIPSKAVQPNASKPANAGISNLPQGFFDNPVDDLNARGITLEQYSAKVEKEEQGELDAFLTEVKGLDGDRELAEEATEQQEGVMREFEEEAAQMTYMANLYALRAKSEQLSGSSSSSGGRQSSDAADGHSADREAQEALQKLLQEAEAVRRVTETAKSSAHDVDAILYQKLAQDMVNKRKRSAVLSKILAIDAKDSSKDPSDDESGSESGEDSDNSDSDNGSDDEDAPPARKKYVPLNYMDWTARNV